MAAMAGTAREMVGRALKELEATGAIRIQRGRITVLSRERLETFA
jgi:CRP/FNR family transcriptional regulator